MFTWSFFYRYLFSPRSGSLIRVIAKICIAGIAVGVFSFITILSIMTGFHQSIQKRYLKIEPHLVIQQTQLTTEQLKTIPYYQSSFSYEAQDIFFKTYDGLYSGGIAKGYNRSHLTDLFTQFETVDTATPPSSSGFLTHPSIHSIISELKEDEVLIGSSMALSLGILEGDSLIIMPPESLLLPPGEVPTYKKVTVKYIFNSNVPEYDSSYIFYLKDPKSLSQFSHTATFTHGLEIKLSQPNQFQQAKNYILHHLQVAPDKVDSWMDRNSLLFFALKVEKFTIGTFLCLSALIASFSIVTILYLLMTQKKQDIGILLTMGLSIQKTQKLFTKLGLLLSGLGVIIGITLGVLVSLVLQFFPVPILPQIYFDRTIPAQVDIFLVGYVILGSTLLSFITAWIPTHFLVNYSPVEALRK